MYSLWILDSFSKYAFFHTWVICKISFFIVKQTIRLYHGTIFILQWLFQVVKIFIDNFWETDALTFWFFGKFAVLNHLMSTEKWLNPFIRWKIVLEALYFPACSIEISLHKKTHIKCDEWIIPFTALIYVTSDASSTAEKTVGCPGLFSWIPQTRMWSIEREILNITLAFLSDIFPDCIRCTASSATQ